MWLETLECINSSCPLCTMCTCMSIVPRHRGLVRHLFYPLFGMDKTTKFFFCYFCSCFSLRLSCYSRPVTVCWCSSLPSSPLAIKSTLYILQHPLEEKRNLRTGRILELSLPQGQCHVIKGRKFSPSRQTQLQKLFSESEKERTLVFYPSKNSINLTKIPPGSYNILVIDGKASPHHLAISCTKSIIVATSPPNYD